MGRTKLSIHGIFCFTTSGYPIFSNRLVDSAHDTITAPSYSLYLSPPHKVSVMEEKRQKKLKWETPKLIKFGQGASGQENGASVCEGLGTDHMISINGCLSFGSQDIFL